uniref:Hypothetical capsid protein n=1 Tax=uncultured virus TaxID=340016 RepID=A0A1D8MK79_9VIRU|nr:hypothetical capsid protein [uncultured virus]
MARPLNKRQRQEVRSIVSAAVSPEWKRYQGTVENKGFDETSAGAGYDLVASIDPGTGSNNRLGRRIRVKRIEIWATLASPANFKQIPYTAVISAVYRARNSSVGAALVDTLSEFFDPVANNRFVYASAPTEANEAIAFNHKIYRMKRFRLMGAVQTSNFVYNMPSGGLTPLYSVVPTVETKQQTGSGVLGAFSVTVGSLAGNEGTTLAPTVLSAAHNITAPAIQHDPKAGTALIFFKHVIKFGGKGLLVGYEDVAFEGAFKQNHVYWNFASSLPEGDASSSPTWCPNMSAAYRVWFTDD